MLALRAGVLGKGVGAGGEAEEGDLVWSGRYGGKDGKSGDAKFCKTVRLS